MRLNQLPIRRWLGPIGLALAALVSIGGTLQWSTPLIYALTALMFAAVFAARSVDRRDRRRR